MVLLLLPLVFATALLHAGPGHDHSSPTTELRGRFLEQNGLRFDFVLLDDQRVRVVALDDHKQPAAPPAFELQLSGGDRQKPFHLTFVRDETGWTSQDPVPAGDMLPVVLRVAREGVPPVFFRIALDRRPCSGCSRLEYACTCAH